MTTGLAPEKSNAGGRLRQSERRGGEGPASPQGSLRNHDSHLFTLIDFIRKRNARRRIEAS